VTAHVRPGVFFDLPADLPRGRHQLSRKQVQDAQRVRVMMAFTELLADHGYAAVRVGDIASRAAVSSQSFYEVFDSKEACALAAYDHFIEVLAQRAPADLASSETWQEYIQAVLDGYFGVLTADPVAARAFMLEIDGAGAPARERRREAVARLAKVSVFAQEALRKKDPRLKRRPFWAHLTLLYGVRQLTCDVLETAETPDFEELIPALRDWIVAGWYDAQ
jgi:AcrR family transcriptional regulator